MKKLIQTTHMQECPICNWDLSALADEALKRERGIRGFCPGCGAEVHIGYTEAIIWTVTAKPKEKRHEAT